MYRSDMKALPYVVVLCSIAACGDDGDRTHSPQDDPVPPVVEVTPTPVKREVPPPPKPTLQKKPLAELDTFAWMDILEDAGWTDASGGGMAMGAWNQTNITAKKDGVEAKLTIISPTGKPDDPKSSVKVQPPADQLPGLKQVGAAELLRDDFLVAVMIEGNPEAAAELLAHIKRWVVVEPAN